MALSSTSAVRLGLGMALQVVIARQLGMGGLGKYAVALAFVAIFQVIASLGLPRWLIREAARRPTRASEYFYGALVAQLVGATVAYGLLFLVVRISDYKVDTTRALLWAGLSLFPYAFTSSGQAIFQARERMELTATTEVIGQVGQLVAALLLLWTGHGVVALGATIALGEGITALATLWFVRYLGVLERPRIDLAFSWSLVRAAPSFYLLALFVVLFARLDIVIISQMLGERAAGIYNAAYLIVRACGLAITGYSDAIYPALSRLYAASEDHRLFIEAGRRSLRYGLVLALPTAMGIAVLAPQIIALIYRHNQDMRSALVLAIVIWEIIPFFMNAVLSRMLIASDRQQLSVRVALTKLTLSVVYYAGLILALGLPGAALATVLATATGTLLNWRFVTRHITPLSLRRLAFKPGLATAAMGLGLLARPAWGLPASIGAGIGIYLALLLALRTFSAEDWTLLRRLIWQGVPQ